MAAQVGIGVTINDVGGRLQIAAMNPNGSATASGCVQVGDFLVAINGVHLTSETHAKELILGTSGSSLEVELSRCGQSVSVTLWRGEFDTKMKGEAADKANAGAAAEANVKQEMYVRVTAETASSARSDAACGGDVAAFKGQPLP